MNISIDDYDCIVLLEALTDYLDNHFLDYDEIEENANYYNSAVKLLNDLEDLFHYHSQSKYNSLIIVKH